MSRQKELDKIYKLLKLAQSAEEIGSVHEAEKSFAKVQELLDKYNLSMSDLEVHEAANEPISPEEIAVEEGFMPDWMFLILSAVAQANGCYALINSDVGLTIVIGRPADRQVTRVFFEHIADASRALERRFKEAFIGGLEYHLNGFENYATRVGSYMLGVATTIARRIEAVHKSHIQQATNEAASSTVGEGENTSQALVFMEKRYEDAQEWAKEQLQTEKVEDFGFDDGIDGEFFQLGVVAGREVSIGERILSANNEQ